MSKPPRRTGRYRRKSEILRDERAQNKIGGARCASGYNWSLAFLICLILGLVGYALTAYYSYLLPKGMKYDTLFEFFGIRVGIFTIAPLFFAGPALLVFVIRARCTIIVNDYGISWYGIFRDRYIPWGDIEAVEFKVDNSSRSGPIPACKISGPDLDFIVTLDISRRSIIHLKEAIESYGVPCSDPPWIFVSPLMLRVVPTLFLIFVLLGGMR